MQNNIFSVRLDNLTRCQLDELAMQHRSTRGYLVRLLIAREAKQQNIVIERGRVPVRTPELKKLHSEWIASLGGEK